MNGAPTILTYSGQYFNYLQPERWVTRIEDIAVPLSRICRFGGHSKRFYSVAEHCLLAAAFAPPELKLAALLHDASEAFMCDIPRPLKQLLPDYKAVEQRVEDAIYEKFGVTRSPEVKRIDVELLLWEQRHVMGHYDPWDASVPSFQYVRTGSEPFFLTSEQAEIAFSDSLQFLLNQRVVA